MRHCQRRDIHLFNSYLTQPLQSGDSAIVLRKRAMVMELCGLKRRVDWQWLLGQPSEHRRRLA